MSPPPDPWRPGSRSGRLPRAAARAKGQSPPSDHHRPDLPSRPPSHTSNQQRRRVRRAEVSGRGADRGPAAADSPRSPSPPSAKRQTSGAGQPRARPPRYQPALARRQALRLSDQEEHGRPAPFAAAPSYCFTPADRAGGPPGTASANHASPPRAGPNLLASLCGARADRRRALTYSRARKAGEPEPAWSRCESADLTSQRGCLSPG